MWLQRAYSRWLGTEKEEDLAKFKETRVAARRAVRNVKNAWFQDVAEMIERERLEERRCGRQSGTCSEEKEG